MRPLRIAMLTYSLRPRGGVVHALEIAGALARRGHEVELVSLGQAGEEFFRPPPVPARIVRYASIDAPFDARIAAMLAAYRDGLAEPLGEGYFDLIHSQDCLSANAALELRDLGVALPPVIRTVHHVDDFRSPSLIECQNRSILGPDALLCVSEPWVERLQREYGVDAMLVRNGVDTDRYRPPRASGERADARRGFGFGDRFTVLTVGGIEPRKGTITLLEGFAELRRLAPELDPLLVLAGGATLFDYRPEVERFRERLAELGLEDHVLALGSLSDGSIERLYRAADVFAFPSTKEGFGLAALEALASGLPVVASDLDAFRTFLDDGRNARLVPVGDSRALGASLARLGGDAAAREALSTAGLAVAAGYTWERAAVAHEHAYDHLLALLEPVRARHG
jgi:glycosyltransferase-like protein